MYERATLIKSKLNNVHSDIAGPRCFIILRYLMDSVNLLYMTFWNSYYELKKKTKVFKISMNDGNGNDAQNRNSKLVPYK